jgi:hypothetical protein
MFIVQNRQNTNQDWQYVPLYMEFYRYRQQLDIRLDTVSTRLTYEPGSHVGDPMEWRIRILNPILYAQPIMSQLYGLRTKFAVSHVGRI